MKSKELAEVLQKLGDKNVTFICLASFPSKTHQHEAIVGVNGKGMELVELVAQTMKNDPKFKKLVSQAMMFDVIEEITDKLEYEEAMKKGVN